jgi:hypothetical protein
MTAPKKFNPQQQAEYFFRKRNCCTKVWVALETGTNKTFYANDCNATWLQLACGHIKEVEFSYLTGMEYVLAKEKFFRGKYNAIEVYRRAPGQPWPQEPVLKLTGSQKLIVNSDELPSNVRCRVFRKPHDNYIGYDVELVATTVGIPRKHSELIPPTDTEKAQAADILKRSNAIAANWKLR